MKNNRLGMLLIISTLLVIATVIALSLARLRETNMEQIRVQGTGIIRSLTMLPPDILAPGNGTASVLHSLLLFYKHSDFAYGMVTAPDGKAMAEVTTPGTIAPALPLPQNATSLFGDRVLELPATNRKVHEFYGPVMKDGNVAAFIRIGYFDPGYLISSKDLSFFALLALPPFLLVPLIYLMIKREMRPLGDVHEKLEAALLDPEEGHDSRRNGMDIPVLAQKLDAYVQRCEAKISELEKEKANLLASNRLLYYNSNKLNHVLHCLPDGLLILDPAGHITFVSEKVKPLLGVDNDAVLNTPVDAWCEDEELKAMLQRCRTAGSQALRSETIEIHPQKLPDKRIRISTSPLVAATEGAAFGMLIVLHDATREYLAQQASHDFVAHVSHELKSPLNVIGMYCEMLQNDTGEDKAIRIESTNVIHDEVERMAALVNNLLNISKMETGGIRLNRTRVRTDDLLQDVYRNLLPRAEAGNIRMEINVQKEISPILVDKDMVRIAINNLLTNAVKYNKPGGKVSLQAAESDEEIVITVSDTGIGIPENDQPHVFRKFFRAKEGEAHTRSGHGLGLYLANEIVQLHHGRISLHSAPGEGSSFSVHLKKSSVVNRELNIL